MLTIFSKINLTFIAKKCSLTNILTVSSQMSNESAAFSPGHSKVILIKSPLFEPVIKNVSVFFYFNKYNILVDYEYLIYIDKMHMIWYNNYVKNKYDF